MAVVGLLVGVGCARATPVAATVESSPVDEGDSSTPLTTAAQVERRLGKQATVEFTVAEVKHPQRRKAYFLSSSVNFRSPDALNVMFSEEHLGKFDVQDVEGLTKKYLGKRIVASGPIDRDEGQLVVRVSSAEQLTLAGEAAPAVAAGEIRLKLPDGTSRSFSADDLAKLPRESTTTEHEGETLTYEGVTLAELFKAGGVALGQGARGRELTRYVLVSAPDGYQALLSIAEIDPHYGPRMVLLADRCQGKPLPENEGTWRLVIKDDLRQRRWVRSASEIEVRYADGGQPSTTSP